MGRTSYNSTQNFLAATSLNPKAPSRGKSLPEPIMETKLRSEQAKLALLEAELPDKSTPKYTRWADMPPPTPEDEADFRQRFNEIIRKITAKPVGPDAGQTIQDWLIAQGATIPNLPEWKVPLYLNKWVRTHARE